MDKIINLEEFKQKEEEKTTDTSFADELCEGIDIKEMMEFFGVDSPDKIDEDAHFELEDTYKNKRVETNQFMVIGKYGSFGSEDIYYRGASEIEATKLFKEHKAKGECVALVLANVELADVFGVPFILGHEVIEVLQGTN